MIRTQERVLVRQGKRAIRFRADEVLLYFDSSYDVAVIQWITSCLKNRMTTRVITLWRADVMSLTTSVSTMRLLFATVHFEGDKKSHFKGSYDKQGHFI